MPGRGLSEDREGPRPTFAEDRESPRPTFAGCPTPVLSRAVARPSTGLQTGMDIMSYDIQIFHVLVTPGSPQEVRTVIAFRTTNDAKFLRSKSASKALREQLVKELGVEGRVTPQQASKKWENLKKRYKDLKSPKTGSGTDEGEVTAASWQFYDDMHEVLGSRPSIDPVVIVASFSEDPTTLDIVESTATSPPTSPSCSSTTGTSSTTPDTSFTTAAYPQSPETRVKRRRCNPLMDFFLEESAREQRRHEESEAKFAERHKETEAKLAERHKETEAKTDRFLALFERMVEKM
ncbi:unnamed protein product [Boreogadus saida]